MSLNSQGSVKLWPCLKEGHMYYKSGLWSLGQRPATLGAASTGYGSWQTLPFPVPHSPHQHVDEGRRLLFLEGFDPCLGIFTESRRQNMVGARPVCPCLLDSADAFSTWEMTRQREGAAILYNTVPLTPLLGLISRP